MNTRHFKCVSEKQESITHGLYKAFLTFSAVSEFKVRVPLQPDNSLIEEVVKEFPLKQGNELIIYFNIPFSFNGTAHI